MSEKKIMPMRKCSGCGEMKSKKQLIRIVKTPQGEIKLDQSYKTDGRGAYVCNNRSCLEKTKKSRRMERSFGMKIPEDIYTALEEVISENE